MVQHYFTSSRIIKAFVCTVNVYFGSCRDIPRPNLGLKIGPSFSQLKDKKNPKMKRIFPNLSLSAAFWWKFHENRTENNKVTDVYIQISSNY